MPMSRAECDQQEKFDEDVYGSNKSMFETLLLQAIDKAVKGKDWQGDVTVLTTNYNNMADSCMRQAQRRRLLENGHS